MMMDLINWLIFLIGPYANYFSFCSIGMKKIPTKIGRSKKYFGPQQYLAHFLSINYMLSYPIISKRAQYLYLGILGLSKFSYYSW